MHLADKRLDSVLAKLLTRIREKQTLSLRKLSNARKEEIQFGRFISNTKVKVEVLEASLYAQMSGHLGSAHCLLIEDTSQIGFSLSRAIAGLGKVDKGQIQGFYIHPVLSLDAHTYACHGIASLTFINRPWQEEKQTRQEIRATRSKTAFEEKESHRWLSSIAKALPQYSQESTKTVVADREADIYPLLTGLTQELGVDYVIRSRFDRPTQAGDKLLSAVDNWSEQSCWQLAVPATDTRSAHLAKVAIKYGSVWLKKAEGKTRRAQPPHHLTFVVEVKELPDSVVNHEKAIHWVLLTSHSVLQVEQAWQVVEWYKQRWNVEQVFRTLKSKGLRIESSQLEDYTKLQKMTILALIAAVKVIQLIRARDNETQQAMGEAFTTAEQKCMVLVNQQLVGQTAKLHNPYPPQSLAFAAWVIARLAGWSGYQSQRPPGPMDLLTGLQRFNERFLGYQMAIAQT